MNDVASTSLVTVRRPTMMLPYAFKQSLADLELAGRIRVEHVGGDHAVVEPRALGIVSEPKLEVPHGAVHDESRAVASSDQALNDVATPVAEKTSESQALPANAAEVHALTDARVGFPQSTSADIPSSPADAPKSGPPKGVKTSRAANRAKDERGFSTPPTDAQAGSGLGDRSPSKVRSPGPRTRKRRVVMRAPRKRSKTIRGQRACPLERSTS